MATNFDQLPPTLESYSELQRAYSALNEHLFDNQLSDCLITLQREKRTYGYFSSRRFGKQAGVITDEIALNPLMFDPKNMMEFFQTLAHEMCHLWQQHNGKPGRGRYHNKEWSAKMQEIGLMPSSTGKPGGRKTGDSMNDYIIEGARLETVVKEFLKDDFTLWHDRLLELMMEQNPDLKPPTPHDPGTRPPPITGNAPTSGLPTRAKFTCPKCGLNMWGKPSARISCMTCDAQLVS